MPAGDYGRLAGAAVGVMFVGFAEGLGAAKTYADREHYDIDANRELLGLGARPDLLAAVAAMLGVLLFDTLPGLFIGIAVSLALLVHRASHPHIAALGRVARTDAFADLRPRPDPPGVVAGPVGGFTRRG